MCRLSLRTVIALCFCEASRLEQNNLQYRTCGCCSCSCSVLLMDATESLRGLSPKPSDWPVSGRRRSACRCCGSRHPPRRSSSTNVFSSGSPSLASVRRASVMSLIVTRSDGSNEEALVSEPVAEAAYGSTPGWSPDGRLIAYTRSRTADALGQLNVFDLTTRQTHVVMSTNDMQLFHPQWSADQNSLLLLFAGKSTGLTRRQIGAVSYPGGTFRTVTNDTNNYVGLTLSHTASALVSVVSKTMASIEVGRSRETERRPGSSSRAKPFAGSTGRTTAQSCTRAAISSWCARPTAANVRCSFRIGTLHRSASMSAVRVDRSFSSGRSGTTRQLRTSGASTATATSCSS